MRTAWGFLMICLAGVSLAQRPGVYNDPKGRFSAHVPQGWSATQLNPDAVSFGSGNAFSTLMVLAGANPQAIIDSVVRQYAPQWKNFVEARRGETRFAGRTGPYITYSGVNPKGLDSYLQVLGVTDGAFTYLLTSTAPKTEFARMKPGFDQIEQSVTLNAAKAPAAVTAPAASPKGGGNANYYHRMKKVSVIDQQGFERPIPALNLLLPADWQFQGAELIFGLRAPQGELSAKEKFFMMVLSTVKVDPQWQARVNQVVGNISAAETKGAADRSRIIAQNGRDISNIISQSYENTSKSHDRAMDGWGQYMRGVETYRNPSTGESVELSNNYGNAWAGPNGQYILSDSTGFDPNTMNMGNWTRMQQVRR